MRYACFGLSIVIFFAINSSDVTFLFGVKAVDALTSRVVANNKLRDAARKKKLALLKKAKDLQNQKNKRKKPPARVVQPVKKPRMIEDVVDDYDDSDDSGIQDQFDDQSENIPFQKKRRVQQEEVKPSYDDEYDTDLDSSSNQEHFNSAIGFDDYGLDY